MNKKLMIGLISILALALLGCGQMVKQTQPADSGPPVHQQIGAQGSEVVLARSSVILNLGSTGVNKQSVDALASQSVQVLADVNLVMPPMTTFQVSSNVSFNIKTNAVLEAGGQIDINVFYNNVLETGLNKVFVRARLLSGNGLTGKTLTTSIIPLDLAVDAGAYTRLSSANLSVREWNKPFNDVISQTLSLKLRGDFTRAISQQYQGTIVFELVKDVTKPLTIGLVAYYPFNANANDESGNGNNGTVYGATLTADRFGNTNKALSFDGTSDWMEIANTSILNSQHTIILWAMINQNGNYSIMSKAVQGNGYGIWIGRDQNFNQGISNGGQLYFGFDQGRQWFWSMINSSNNIVPGHWYQIAAVVNNNTQRLFINGVEQMSVNIQGLPSIDTTIWLGRERRWGNGYLNGSLDDIRIYNRALSESEVQQLYYQEKPVNS